MTTDRKPSVTLYVDRTSGQWIVRDLQGQWWAMPSTTDAWTHRVTYEPGETTQLEVIPGHYKFMLGIPH